MNYLQSILDTVKYMELDALSFLMDIAIVCAIFLVLSFLGRMIFGKRSNLNHAISSAI